MNISVLGPVEVSSAGAALRLSRRQQRLILGILAMEANTEVSLDRLVDLIWAGRPPRQARAAVHSRVSELRAILDRAPAGGQRPAVNSTRTGYLLMIAREHVDVHRFRQLVAYGRQTPNDATARDVLNRALDLWRGPVLGGSVTEGPLAAICRNLESTRLTVVEDLCEIELRLGHERQVLDQALSDVAAHPTRERLVGNVMLALHRTGRTAEALELFDRSRRILRDELGIDPSTELQALHVAVLRNGAALNRERTAVAAGP